MKILVLLLLAPLAAYTVCAEDIILELDPINEGPRDYSEQVSEKFEEVVVENEEIRKALENYSKPARERSGGKYMGPDVQSFVLHRSENVNFLNSGGWRQYSQTLVLYFSFAEGMHKGMEAKTGVFAIFEISGEQTYDHKKDDEFELRKHSVSAKFEGFRRTIGAEPNGAEKPATALKSKSEDHKKSNQQSDGRSR